MGHLILRVRLPGSPGARRSLNRGSPASEVPARSTLPCPEAATAIPCIAGLLLSHAHVALFLEQGPVQTPLALLAARVLRAHGTPCGTRKAVGIILTGWPCIVQYFYNYTVNSATMHGSRTSTCTSQDSGRESVVGSKNRAYKRPGCGYLACSPRL